MKTWPMGACLMLLATQALSQSGPLQKPETFLSVGGSQELSVTVPSNAEWRVQNREFVSTSGGRAPFFQLGEVTSGRGNGKVKVIVPANTENTIRTGSIGIEVTLPADASGNMISNLTSVPEKQLAFTVSASTLNFNANGGIQTVTLTADTDWQVTSSSQFLTVYPRSGSGSRTISVTCLTFPTSLPVRYRVASLTISNGPIIRTVTVNQTK